MNFSSVDLSVYGLIAKKGESPFMPPININQVEIADKAYDFRAFLRPRIIRIDCIVQGDDKEDLIANLDAISKVLNPMEGVKNLILDFPNDRHYRAKVANQIFWDIITHRVAQGELIFICADPLGYSTTETSSDHNINADPKTVEETTGGTAYIEPIYTLTAGQALNDVTIKVKNLDTEEELQWQGSLANTNELEIDVALWIVKKEDAVSMATVSGQFPRLIPSSTNRIKVTGFSTTGSLNITYRNTYL